MSEIKFACPTCTQHLTAGPDLFGQDIACPNCQATLVVPGEGNLVSGEAASLEGAQRETLPKSVRFLALYYIVGAVPVMLFALFCFTIPPEELTNHPEQIERDRAFLQILKVVMFGGLFLYALIHEVAGFGLLRGKRWSYWMAMILSILGALHLNPFAVPGLVICLRQNVRAYMLPPKES